MPNINKVFVIINFITCNIFLSNEYVFERQPEQAGENFAECGEVEVI